MTKRKEKELPVVAEYTSDAAGAKPFYVFEATVTCVVRGIDCTNQGIVNEVCESIRMLAEDSSPGYSEEDVMSVYVTLTKREPYAP